MECRILGALECLVDGVALPLGAPRHQKVLARLVMDAGRVVPLRALISAVWEDDPPASAARLVRNAVSDLRVSWAAAADLPAGQLILTEGDGYSLALSPGSLDAQRFEEAVGKAETAVGQGDLASGAALLRSALGLWRGAAFAGLSGPVFAAAAARWEERRLLAWQRRVAVDLALGHHPGLLGELTAMTAEHPYHEVFAGQLMLALYRCGRAADALAVFAGIRRRLVDDLGVEPGQELARLHLAVLRREVPAALQPWEVRPATVPAQLPPDLPDFTGRQGQTEAIVGHLLSGDRLSGPAPIAAIAGMGGVGKTALAVHAAHRCLAAFPDGQLYVNLRDPDGDPVDPADALEGFLFALGADVGAIPAGLARRVDVYRSRLAGRRVLVVLDNASGEGQVRPLLPAGPGCAALVTSRVPLAGLEGAIFTDLDVLGSQEAVTLLARIAGEHRVAAEPQAANEILRWCDRIPLALRIAGARLATRPHWTLERLAEALGDERQRLDELTAGDLAVRASIALSYADLPEATRRAFRMLGMLDTDEVLPSLLAAALDVDVAQAGKHIELLVDARLVSPEQIEHGCGCRYCFHDLVHLFARERAEAEDNAGVRLAAISRIQSTWATDPEGTTASRPIRFDRVTAIPRSSIDALPDADKAEAYDRLARFHIAAYEPDDALHAAQTALEIAQRLGLSEVAANSGVTIHTVRYLGGDSGAVAELRAVAESLRRNGPPSALRRATINLAFMCFEEGDAATALRLKAVHARTDPLLGNPLHDSLRTATGALFDGDWDLLLSATDHLASQAPLGWHLDNRCARTWILVLRGQAYGQSLEPELLAILAAGRNSGWLVSEWTTLAHIAFCRALQGRAQDACALLGELVQSWRRVRAFVSGVWITPAAHAAALCGPAALALLRDPLADPSRLTPWIRAARHTVAGGLAVARGDDRQAVTEHLAAARIYEQAPNVTDRMMAMATALARLGPDDPRAADVGHVVRAFADRVNAPGLLDRSVFGQPAGPHGTDVGRLWAADRHYGSVRGTRAENV